MERAELLELETGAVSGSAQVECCSPVSRKQMCDRPLVGTEAMSRILKEKLSESYCDASHPKFSKENWCVRPAGQRGPWRTMIASGYGTCAL